MSFDKGDRVKVIRDKKNSDTDWVTNMSKLVGKEGIVESSRIYTCNINVSFDDQEWWFPIDALQLVIKDDKLEEVNSNKKTKEQLYLEFQEQIDIKVGDTVQLIGTSAGYQFGWTQEWDVELDDKYDNGSIALVENIDYNNGFEIKFVDDIEDADSVEDCITYYVPFFILEKIDDYKFEIIEINDDYTAFITKNGVKVGCQTIDLQTAVEVGEVATKFLKK
jgi:hypothetical protein